MKLNKKKTIIIFFIFAVLTTLIIIYLFYKKRKKEQEEQEQEEEIFYTGGTGTGTGTGNKTAKIKELQTLLNKILKYIEDECYRLLDVAPNQNISKLLAYLPATLTVDGQIGPKTKEAFNFVNNLIKQNLLNNETTEAYKAKLAILYNELKTELN